MVAKYAYWTFFVLKIRVLAPSVLNARIFFIFFHAMVDPDPDLDHVLNAKVIQLCSESGTCLFTMSVYEAQLEAAHFCRW